jgi:8-oxo-dGTP pyrophosphatase MutT (NUDIX family)
MQIGNGTAVSPFSAATVLMLRDAPQGLEVYLVKRHGLSEVLGGAYVFPGGKLDMQDIALVARLDRSPAVLHAELGEQQLSEAHAAALYVAAIREVFEETGVLFATCEAGGTPEARTLHGAGRRFDEALALVDAPLATAPLAPWSRWITPIASVRARKHFDTRFFVASVPAGQEPVHDERETTASVWLTPRQSLRDYWTRKIALAPPQIMTLAHLSRYGNVADVLAEARSRKPIHVQPEAVSEGVVQMVCYPGDERHSIKSRAMPGPTRLCWRNDRYEPDGGSEALLDPVHD